MSQKKPPAKGSGRECPVCGQSSYSKNGIHPQCASIQADMPRQKKLVEERKKAAETKKEKPRPTFTKQCPKCKAEVHVRLKVCPCGKEF